MVQNTGHLVCWTNLLSWGNLFNERSRNGILVYRYISFEPIYHRPYAISLDSTYLCRQSFLHLIRLIFTKTGWAWHVTIYLELTLTRGYCLYIVIGNRVWSNIGIWLSVNLTDMSSLKRSHTQVIASSTVCVLNILLKKRSPAYMAMYMYVEHLKAIYNTSHKWRKRQVKVSGKLLIEEF